MAEMLELSDKEFKMLRAQMEKTDSMEELMSNIGRDIKTLRNN